MQNKGAWFLYYVGCFVALVVLASLPKFIGTTGSSVFLVERAILLMLFIGVAWFFTKALHDEWRWSVLSSLFYVEAISAVACALLLFLQFFHDAFLILTILVLLLRSAVQAYLVSRRVTHLRGLVYFTSLFLLVCGELVLSFGFRPLI